MTKYYVRNMDCGEFLPSEYTRNEFLFIYADTYICTAPDMMPALPYGASQYFRLFTVCVEDGVQKTPRNRTGDVHLSKLTQLGLPNSKTGVYIGYSAPNANLLDSWDSYGWADPDSNRSGFLTELCNFFETAKVADSSIYGTDNDEVNLYLITWVESGTNRYLPLFKMGVDSHYDTLIEI